MPNTLAHIGIQTLLTRAVIRGADVKWIWAGCIIPDLPWIGQRAVRALMPEVSPFDIRLYAIVQSSLLLCLVGAAALACLSDRSRRVFAILALGCLMHLMMDALQTKWANGVHLFAPLSWEMWNAGLFWPEGWLSQVLSVLGLVVAAYAMLRLPADGSDLQWPRGRRLAGLVVLGAVYLAGPAALMSGPWAANSHFVKTLSETGARPGQQIEIDRNRVVSEDGGLVLQAWPGERISLSGPVPETPGKYSLMGTFRDPGTIEVTAVHAHPSGLRDKASYLGLVLVLLFWARCAWRRVRMRATG